VKRKQKYTAMWSQRESEGVRLAKRMVQWRTQRDKKRLPTGQWTRPH